MIFILNVDWHQVQINAIVSCLHKVKKATELLKQHHPKLDYSVPDEEIQYTIKVVLLNNEKG